MLRSPRLETTSNLRLTVSEFQINNQSVQPILTAIFLIIVNNQMINDEYEEQKMLDEQEMQQILQ
jgi:hypothetical protein